MGDSIQNHSEPGLETPVGGVGDEAPTNQGFRRAVRANSEIILNSSKSPMHYECWVQNRVYLKN